MMVLNKLNLKTVRFICKQADLSQALNTVNRVVSAKTTLPVLNNVLLEAKENKLILSTTNLEIAIQHQIDAEVKEEGAITIPVKLITQYITLTNIENVNGEVLENNTLHITTDISDTKIKGISPEEFPLIPSVEKEVEFDIPSIKLIEALNQTYFASSIDGGRPVLSGVYFDIKDGKLKAVATDSYRLAEKTIELKDKNINLQFIVPSKTILELIRILTKLDEDVKVIISKNQILFLLTNTKLISRTIEGQYPPYEQIIPQKVDTKAKLKILDFVNATKKASLFTQESAGNIRIRFEKNKIVLMADTDQLGSENTEVKGEVEGPDKEIAFNGRYIIEALNCIDGEEIEFGVTTESSPGVITPKDDPTYLHVVMPLKL